jgi:hypothetical protein
MTCQFVIFGYFTVTFLLFKKLINDNLSFNCVILSTNKRGSNKLKCYLVMDLIKHFWYLIHVERQKETVTVQVLMSQVTPMKTIRMMLVSVIIRQFGRCFGLFVIAG